MCGILYYINERKQIGAASVLSLYSPTGQFTKFFNPLAEMYSIKVRFAGTVRSRSKVHSASAKTQQTGYKRCWLDAIAVDMRDNGTTAKDEKDRAKWRR